ncbi:hypothetical protein BH10ACT10_BH10ACT10_17860 [soil metagenome]
MTIVLLLSTMVLLAMLLWVARRHRAALAWNRELEVAFHTDERLELKRHRLF